MSGTGSLVAFLLAVPPSLADVPMIDRARPNFYGAVADRLPVTVAWSVMRDGGDIALTLTIRGAANPTEVTKPDIRPLMNGRFQVLDRVDPPSELGTIRFAYSLRPVASRVSDVPALPFAYYQPRYPEGRRMLTAYAEPVAIPAVASDPDPLPVPSVETLPEVPLAGTTVPGSAWLVPIGFVPLIVVVGIPLAGRLFPDSVRRAELRRVRAVCEALDDLEAARQGDDPAGATAAAVRRFLAMQPAAVSERFAELLERCDAVRFGPPGGEGAGLPVEAANLIHDEASGRFVANGRTTRQDIAR